MEEDPNTAAKRGALRGEREKFVRALDSIEELERGAGSSTMSEEDLDDHMVDVPLMSGALPVEEV